MAERTRDESGAAAAVTDVAGLGYEAARDQLVEVVRRLEAGGEPLEASLALWERGEALAERCQGWLDGARARLEAAGAPGPGSDGGPSGGPDPAADGTRTGRPG